MSLQIDGDRSFRAKLTPIVPALVQKEEVENSQGQRAHSRAARARTGPASQSRTESAKVRGSGDSVTALKIETTIGGVPIQTMRMLSEVTILDEPREIGNSCFCESGLVTITLPRALEWLGNYAFENCKALGTVSAEASCGVDVRGYTGKQVAVP